MEFPKIMGVLNVTPDSFSDGGQYTTVDRALRRVEQMVKAGVDLVDVGGESSRPGAVPVSEEEELRRVMPVIQAIRKRFPALPISVDTTKYRVAAEALAAGAQMINDISGLRFEPRFVALAAEYDAGLILMHMQGTPQTMQQNPRYENVVAEVYHFLQQQIRKAQQGGVRRIYADVGIGFGKTVEHNLELLRHLDSFQTLGVPLVLGISRKSLFRHLLHIEKAVDRDVPTLAMHLLLLRFSPPVAIIRVHAVELLSMARRLWEVLYESTGKTLAEQPARK